MRWLSPFLLISLAAFCGCKFHRSVVNEYVRDIDTSWITPGVTTRSDIIDRIGVSPSTKEGGGISGSSFRWVCADTFTGTLEAGYIVTPTFERGTMYYSEDILVTFDREGVVELVSRTRSKDGKRVEIVEWRERK